MQELVVGTEIADILEPYASVERVPGGSGCWVLANMVGGLDGSAAFGGRVGPLSEGADVELFRQLRAVADVVLVGASTFRGEGYGPVELPETRCASRVRAGRSAVPRLAIVSGSLDLDWTARAFSASRVESRPLVITAAAADAERLDTAEQHAEVVIAGADRVDLREALAKLAGGEDTVILCEGGPTLLGELVGLGLLDELCLTIAPIMGGDELPIALAPRGTALARFTMRHVATDGRSLFLRYERDAS
ncbi:MAG: pyrimidine reductase family protein [Acidimicrobiales bacterium]